MRDFLASSWIGVLARGALAVLAVGLTVQVGFAAHEAIDQLQAPRAHPLRGFLLQADRLMRADAFFAATSPRVSDAARYLLYPRQRMTPTFTRRSLEAAGVDYVIVTPGHRPPALTGRHDWDRVLLATPRGRVLEVQH
jgi:hypothetical protein